MYCGGKKHSPSSSHTSIINRVFQVSWFPKFKHKGINPETKPSKTQHSDKPYFPTINSPLPAFRKEARFYSVDDDDDDAYWRLSFREQRTEDRKSITSDPDDKFQIPVSNFTRTPRKKDRRSRNLRPDDVELKSSKPVEKDIFPVETENKVHMKEGFQDSAVYTSENQQNVSFRNISLTSVEEDYAFGRLSKKGWKNMDKLNDKTEFHRKTHCRKTKQKNRANNYSPKRELRVRVLEDMKKEKMRRVVEGRTVYDSFAEVKTSFDPQQDFRDSMVEMIREKGIRRREELEDLLACYLTLNCDEYHDLIIRVFQQVWFELSSGVY